LCYWFLIRTFTVPPSSTHFLDTRAPNWRTMRIPWVLGMLLLAPPFVNMLGTRLDVYEEVVAYGYLYSLALFAGFLRTAQRPTAAKLLLLALWAGFGAWVRPTLLFYGVVTVVFACVIAWKARIRVTVIAGVLLLFFLCGAGLGYTNMRRFGGFFEFGHSLNLESGLYWNTYSLKFDYPFHREPFLSAAKDELGTLFFTRKLNGGNFYAPDAVWGQSRTLRWHEMYFSTFNVLYLALLVGSIVIWITHFPRHWVVRSKSAESPQLPAAMSSTRLNSAFAIFAVPWAALSFLLLFGFYLWSPSMSSRYNVDFLPAVMVGISGLVWNAFELNFFKKTLQARVWFVVAGLWVSISILVGRIHPDYAPHTIELVGIQSITDLSIPSGSLPELRHYQFSDSDRSRSIPFNCDGWNLADGSVQPVITLFASDPECVVLSVFNPDGTPITSDEINPIRAKIGLEYLVRESLQLRSTNATIVFRGPQEPRLQRGLQVCFLSFIRPAELGRKTNPIRLSSVSFVRGNLSKEAEVIAADNGGFHRSQQLTVAARMGAIGIRRAFELPEMQRIPEQLRKKLNQVPDFSTRCYGEEATFVGSWLEGG
jgi:hypothetical protein